MLSILESRRSLRVALSVIAFAALFGAAESTLAGNYSAAVLADNPVAYYRLGETSGTTAANSSANGATLNGNYVNFGAAQTLPATPSTIGELGPRPGDPSGANTILGLESDNIGIRSGANGTTTSPFAMVEVSDNALLDITGALTLEAWVYRDPQSVNGNNEGIVGKFVGNIGGVAQSNRAYCLYYNSRSSATAPAVGFILNTTGAAAGNVDFQTTTAGGGDIPMGSTGGWTYLAAVYEPGVRMSIYMNGVSIGEKTTLLPASPIFNSAAPLWIGRQFQNTSSATSYEGKIDEVAVYNVALSPQTIAEHYQAALVPEPSTLVLAGLGIAGIGIAGVRRRTRV